MSDAASSSTSPTTPALAPAPAQAPASSKDTALPVHAQNRPKIDKETIYLTPSTSLFRALPASLSLLPASLLPSNTDGNQGDVVGFLPVVAASAYAPLGSWQHVMDDLIRHPERNSSNILRAEVLEDEEVAPSSDTTEGYVLKKRLRRRILPRRPGLDWEMEQECRLYHRLSTVGGDVEEAVVIYTPLLSSQGRERFPDEGIVDEAGGLWFPAREEHVPFYHPKVRAIAFRFFPSSDATADVNDAASEGDAKTGADGPLPTYGRHSICLIPFADPLTALPPTHRLSRISLHLLTTLHTHTWGHTHSYVKRVHHDVVVPRSAFQDLYLLLKSRYASHLIATWCERTDPKKHVFEDLGIAAFLILLWRGWWGDETTGPPGGFVDVGCGNGLLVWILNAEGFKGYGFDLRARKSWDVYGDKADLRVETFDVRAFVERRLHHNSDEDTEGFGKETKLFPPHCLIIGNHADELTPWFPLLSTSLWMTTGCSGFINIPCCPYLLSGVKYSPTHHHITRDVVAELLSLPTVLSPSQETELDETIATLERGPASSDITQRRPGAESRNIAYIRYLSLLHLACGWTIEKEALRIPSTKNWTLVARRMVCNAVGNDRVRIRALKEATRQRCMEALKGTTMWTPRDFVEGASAETASHTH